VSIADLRLEVERARIAYYSLDGSEPAETLAAAYDALESAREVLWRAEEDVHGVWI
jgi:hypothetical protein